MSFEKMIEIACAAIVEPRGYKWPAAFDAEEQETGRENMRRALAAIFAARGDDLDDARKAFRQHRTKSRAEKKWPQTERTLFFSGFLAGRAPPPSSHVAGVEPVDFNKLYTHPLAQQFHEVVQAVDRLPGDSTNPVASLIYLKKAVEDEINRLLRNAKADATLLKRYHEWCGQHGCEPSTSDLYGTPSPQPRAEGNS